MRLTNFAAVAVFALSGIAASNLVHADVALVKVDGSLIVDPIACDALTVVINPKNGWSKDVALAAVKAIREPVAR